MLGRTSSALSHFAFGCTPGCTGIAADVSLVEDVVQDLPGVGAVFWTAKRLVLLCRTFGTVLSVSFSDAVRAYRVADRNVFCTITL